MDATCGLASYHARSGKGGFVRAGYAIRDGNCRDRRRANARLEERFAESRRACRTCQDIFR